MKTKEIIKKLEKEKEKIKSKGVKKIGIFGSVIKGKKNPNDIDFLVEFRKTNADNYFGLLYYLEKLFNKKIDLVIESGLKPEVEYVKQEVEYVKI